ncbi:MAG: tRNA (N(6)-L-threonylcarbamoyladenosine(37)-C(2))-methylthiotransferase MtaB, partial [Odoribacter sp.]|nr:tRNA (N(6)-L-threonylcarbamoyladenosine(37)-C(2))-methylthiotransferase MtaB [Odoribacter sp.]
ELVAENKKLLPHFHIPLQSGNNKILGLMRRRYRIEHFADRIGKIRALLPFAGIGADVIVGFPGESEADFESTLSFLKNQSVSYLHVFSYSSRPGTIAETLPDAVSHTEKERRSKILSSLSESKTMEFSHKNIGETTEVLFEMTKSEGMITGFTRNYLRAEAPWEATLAGEITKVRISGISESGKLTVDFI